MSQDTPASDRPVAAPAAVVPPAAAPSRPAAAPPRRGGSGAGALALLLALLASIGVGYVGWRQWQQLQRSDADSRNVDSLQQRVGKLESTLDGVSAERASLRQRLGDAAQVNQSMREELLGQSERVRNLEDAVAKLSEKSLSGHDSLLLDETESLLRMGQQRYTLAHDAEGAAAAYALADQSVAALDDGAYSSLRQSIQAERDALGRSQPQTRAAQLAELGRLREAIVTLPLKPLDAPAGAQAESAWSRILRALGSVVTVRRDDGAPLAVADARLARSLAALDLAQADAALLAYDGAGASASLRRVDAIVASQFDGSDPAVKQFRRVLAQLAAPLGAGAPVELGAALKELRNLRAVRALKPSAAGAVPAPASSASAPAGGAAR